MRKGAPGLDKQEEVRMMKQLAVGMQRNWRGAGGELKGRGVCWHLHGAAGPLAFLREESGQQFPCLKRGAFQET